MEQYELNKEMARKGYFTVDKGSVTVNGVSLTVCEPTDNTFTVAILHPLTVGLMGVNDNEKTVGFLHDLIEDCDWSIEDLQTEGFLDEVVEAVDILTHRKDEDSYDEYVNKIILSGNRLAINVKLNDLHHNLQRGKVSYEAAVASNDTAKIKELERINAKHEKALERIKNAEYEQ